MEQANEHHKPPPPEPLAGVQCPHCHSRLNTVVVTRRVANMIRRVRECFHCGHRYQTREEITSGLRYR